MVNKIIDKRSSEINLLPSNELNLSLLIGPDRFTYLVYSVKERRVLQLIVFESKLSLNDLSDLLVTIAASEIDLKNLNSIDCTFYHFDIFNNPSFLFPFKSKNHQNERLSDLKLADYYSVALSAKQFLEAEFSGIKFKDKHAALLTAFKSCYKEKAAIFSHWESGKIFFCSLIFGQSEQMVESVYKSSEDALYYVLHFYKVSGLNKEKDKIFIAGELLEDSSIFKLIYNFVANIEFVKNPTDLLLRTEEELPEQLYFDVLSATL